MILVVCTVLALATVPLTGGDLRRLGGIRLRSTWLVWLAVAVQATIMGLPWSPPDVVSRLLHVGTYVLAAAFVVVNARIPGVLVVAAGGVLNAAAIFANGGVMPASASARRVAGLAEVDGFSNSAPIAAPRLWWLGDIFAVPKGWPFANVFSIGDVIIIGGVIVLAQLVCRRPLTAQHLEKVDVRR